MVVHFGFFVLRDMVRVRVSLACCAWLACAGPVVNVIAEPPAGLQESSGDANGLEVAFGQVARLAQDVREGEHQLRQRARDALEAQSSAMASLNAIHAQRVAGFVSLGGADSDAARLESLLASVAGGVGPSHGAAPLVEPGFEIPEAEVEIRKSLLDAGKQFADASAGAAAAGGATASSFLQPVDANRLRGSLRVTEPMRSPAPMAVNVIMAEDVRRMQRKAAERGVSEQLARLKRDFETDLSALA